MTVIKLLIAGSMAAQLWAASPEAKQFEEGEKATFSSAGHPKAAGIALTLSYPKDWTPMEDTGKNLVTQLISPKGSTLAVGIHPMSVKPTEADRKAVLGAELLKKMVAKEAKLLSTTTADLGGIPAGVVYHSRSFEVGTGVSDTESVTYAFFVDKALITVIGTVGSPQGSQPTAAEKMASLKELFLLIAQSLKFPAPKDQ
jgi:hypothetical protein